MNIAIIYTTAREDPKLEWLIRDLDRDLDRDDTVELAFVDFFGRTAESLGATRHDHPWLTDVKSSPPKPCPWQGRHRVTPENWWAMSNARNTGLVMVDQSYVVFLDDRCWLEPGWIPAIRLGERERATVLAGPYDKHVDDGVLGAPISIDHRRQHAPLGQADCGGGWLFGGNMALPLEWALEINGFEEGCDPVGGEDYIFGQMLCHRGRRIDFDANMLIQQDRKVAVTHPFPRNDKGISPNDKSHAMNWRFGARTRTEFTADLSELRAAYRELGYAAFPLPDPNVEHLDWYDQQPIKDMLP